MREAEPVLTIAEPGAVDERHAATPYALIVESMTEGVSLSDEDGTIVYTNPAEDRMFGYAPGELVGRHVSIQNAYPPEENARRVAEVIDTLRSRGAWEGEWHNRRKDGTDFYTASRITAVQVEGRTCWLCVQRDVTAIRAAEAAHRESEERLALSIEGTGVGIYDLDLSTGTGFWSESAFRMLGYEPGPGGAATFEMWRSRLHPEDEAYVLGNHVRAGETGVLSIEFRIVRADTGETRWLTAFGRMLEGPRGTRSIGTVLDTTERRRTEEALRENEARLRLAMEAGRLGSWWFDARRGCGGFSEASARMLGLPEGQREAPYEEWRSLVHPDDRASAEETFRAALAGETPGYESEYRILHANGEVRRLETLGTVERDASGAALRVVGTFRDITEQRRAEEHQRLLINELNHRVKNTLAIIQGIAQQTFKDSEVGQERRDAFEGRLAALSAAHNLLTRENWEAASIRQVVEAAVGPYSAQGRISVSGPDMRLAPRTAVSLALAVHELGTNAAKYGALSGASGTVTLRWRASGGRLGLVWRERGGPEVAPPARRGFGTRMIERALASELGGAARIDFRPAGLVCTVDARLPDA